MDRTNPAGCLYLDEQRVEQPRPVSAFLPIGHWKSPVLHSGRGHFRLSHPFQFRDAH